MTMSGSQMATDVITNMNTLSDAEKLQQSKVLEQFCKAIVDHIKNNAEVTTSVSTTVASGIDVEVDPDTGVGSTTGTGSGTGSGTGTVE